MNAEPFINILIAEDNQVSLDFLASIMKTHGYNVILAKDGGEAIDKLDYYRVDLALLDINMAPKGGFEFAKHLIVNGIRIPTVVITGDDSSDILIEAGNLGITRVMHKPVNPDQLLKIIHQIVKKHGMNPEPLGIEEHETHFTPEELMKKAISLAQKNIDSKKGRPFGAIIADQAGRIVGEGTNGISSRVDPVAHAEVMAIRQAAEKLGQTSLQDCTLYCSSQPTKIGQALIESVGIQKVYYGLSHEDIGLIREHSKTKAPSYEQICKDDALKMFKNWKQD